MLTNDELKKKIISALQSVEFVTEKGWCGQCISLRLDYSAIADALIAAEIGDVKEEEHRADKAEQLKNQYCRALLNLARRYVVKTNMTLSHGSEPHSRSTDIEMLALYIIANECEQAEKELAEERK